MEIKTADVVGLGALGVLYADRLTAGLGKENVRVLSDGARAARYEREGVFFNGERCNFSYRDAAAETRPAELLLFSVKFGGLAAAMEECRHLVDENTIILSVLNGVSSEELLSQAFGGEKVVWCVAQKMSAVKEGNQAYCHQPGELALGVPAGQSRERLEAVAALLRRVGLGCALPEDIRHHMWGKLICNDGCNQVCMVFEGGYALVQRPGKARETMLAAMEETMRVGAAGGAGLTEADVKSWLAVIDSLDPEGEPSMRQDAKAHRKSEVELFAGTVIRCGQKHGISVPVNQWLYDRIREMEANY